MIRIRKERPPDRAAIREVNIRAFGQEDEADLVDELRRNRGDLLSLVAATPERIVAHALFSPATVAGENRTVRGMGRGPMAVLPEFQRRGSGARLIRTGIDILRKRRCPFIIVLGHADYYPRFGFEPASRPGVGCEWDVPDEVFMVLILEKPKPGGISGKARYRPEFGRAT